MLRNRDKGHGGAEAVPANARINFRTSILPMRIRGFKPASSGGTVSWSAPWAQRLRDQKLEGFAAAAE